MGERPPLLIRRDAERMLNLAVAWFVAVPVFAAGLLAILYPILRRLGECPRDPCPTLQAPEIEPSFLVGGTAFAIAVLAGWLALRATIRAQPGGGWWIVTAFGVGLIVAALVVDAIVGWVPEALIASALWPLTPGLLALVATRRARQAREAITARPRASGSPDQPG